MNFSVQAMALSFILFLGYHSIKPSTSTDSKISKIEDRKTEFRYDGERSDYIMTKSSTRKKLEIDSRIIGGREVSAHTFPYVASLYIYNFDDKAVFCGGSLISLRLVLTAAHCPDG
ncbi:coagulation factor IX-like isoform X2 [Anthonomus grandis grandis]|nr:coagulation factor IX-like isoform X2 [Anthonomus grandis grandis]